MQTATGRHDVRDYPPPSAGTTTKTGGRKFTIVGAICAVVALIFLPIVFGPVGAVFGFVGYGKGDKAGLWVGVGAIAATFIGLLLAALLFHATHHAQPAR